MRNMWKARENEEDDYRPYHTALSERNKQTHEFTACLPFVQSGKGKSDQRSVHGTDLPNCDTQLAMVQA